MGEARRGRLRLALAAAVAVVLLCAAVLAAHVGDSGAAGPTDRAPAGIGAPPMPVQRPPATPDRPVLRVWSRPTTKDAAEFAGAFAAAIWTYDTDLPYAAWAEAIGSWADPLGSPASARVAMSMLPPPPTYTGLRAEPATATATVESVVVPAQAARLRSRAPDGWQVFVVRGTQHVSTATGSYQATRQATVAVVCDSTCWLYSTTPELPN